MPLLPGRRARSHRVSRSLPRTLAKRTKGAAACALLLFGCAENPSTTGPGSSGDAAMPGPAVAQPSVMDGAGNLPPQGDGSLPTSPAPREDVRCTYPPGTAPGTDYWAAGPLPAGTLEVTLSDTSRPLAASPDNPAASARPLPVRVFYPAAPGLLDLGPPALADGGPFPLLVYSHGFSSSKDEGNRAGNHAASHGYVLVAVDFPLTSMNATGTPYANDVANQPGDVSFLIDTLLAWSEDNAHTLAGAVDPERIGALGVSMGGLTTLMVGYHAERFEPRVRAIAPIAAPSYFFRERFYDTRDIPMLLFHGDQDAFIDYELNARGSLARAAPSARLVTVQSGSHTGFGAPVDGALLGLVQPFFAPPEAHPDNPDGLGCGFVAEDVSNVNDDFLTDIGSPDIGVYSTAEETAMAQPCMGDEYTKPAMPINDQMDILAAGVVAFFEAHFAAKETTRDQACRFLMETLPEHPKVDIE